MDRAYPCKAPADSTLHLILERNAEETIDDEQMRQILEPVLQMIREGRSAKRRTAGAAKPLASA